MTDENKQDITKAIEAFISRDDEHQLRLADVTGAEQVASAAERGLVTAAEVLHELVKGQANKGDALFKLPEGKLLRVKRRVPQGKTALAAIEIIRLDDLVGI